MSWVHKSFLGDNAAVRTSQFDFYTGDDLNFGISIVGGAGASNFGISKASSFFGACARTNHRVECTREFFTEILSRRERGRAGRIERHGEDPARAPVLCAVLVGPEVRWGDSAAPCRVIE